ncbi:MAG: single-stranded DNA-binding protein [Candidatus Xenobia bacterium]
MASYNKVTLIGRLTKDPEMRYTQAGKPVVSFRLAVDRFRGGGQQPGQKEADFFSVTAWDKLAETCSRYLVKGKLVLIEGRLQNRSYTGNDGQERTVTEIVASDMQMLDSGRGRTESGGEVPHPAEGATMAAAAPRPAPAPAPVANGGSSHLDDVGMDDIPF